MATTAMVRLPRGNDLKSWRQGAADMPEWVRSVMVGNVGDNGTFLIATPLGNQRVHRGYIVIRQGGEVYTCPLQDADSKVAEMRDRLRAGSAMVGPGKSMRVAVPTRPKKRGGPKPRRAYPAPKGVPPSIEFVALADLKIDETYQRSIESLSSQRLITSIASRWDWRLSMPLAVSRRDDGRYVIDGQHRHAAAKLRGDIPFLPCCIATYDGPADEAGMFVAANRVRRAVNRLEDFRAALVAGDEDALEVKRIVEAAGLTVCRQMGVQTWAVGQVAFTGSIQNVIGRHGSRLAERCLRLIAAAFPDQVLSNGAAIFLALAEVLTTARVDDKLLLRALRKSTMDGWGAGLRGLNGGAIRAHVTKQALIAELPAKLFPVRISGTAIAA